MVEICVGIWFVDKSEVPPFLRQRPESMPHHGGAQQHAVAELGGVDLPVGRLCVVRVDSGVFMGLRVAAPVRVAFYAEPVEGAAHVNLLLAGHVEESQVNGATSAVARLFGYIALVEKHRLVQIRVEICLHACVGRVLRPVHEMGDSPLRTVCVVYFQAEALFHDIVADFLERFGGLDCQQRRGPFIAVNAVADEIVGRVVADFQYGVRHGLGKSHEARRRGARRGLGHRPGCGISCCDG